MRLELSKSAKKSVILGCCATGAKFTPINHKVTGNRIYDAICSGDLIPVDFDEIQIELARLIQSGCRYWHIHARNPSTREQSCDNELYYHYSTLAKRLNPHLLVSFGGSRNGPEIAERIRVKGEWDRISQIALSLDRGGAHFVTAQAAIELQIVCDLERQGFVEFNHNTGDFNLLRDIESYTPSGVVRKAGIEVNSTHNGGNYGQSSAKIQLELLQHCLVERSKLGLPFEVEWVQHARSRFLTWLLLHYFSKQKSVPKRLNITLLFGFSPRLPFPLSYEDFHRVVCHAKDIATGHPNQEQIKVTVAVGAAILPQHSAKCTAFMDVGPLKGQLLTPIDRLIAYAVEPASNIDVIRVGLEDTPYVQDANYTLLPTTNIQLLQHSRALIERLGGTVLTDETSLNQFIAT